ncbi:MAG TPA: tetratricopeptide repeat protein [Syntrophales bacterium]|nr:tetratricopeptide repeat protein [Syntrophales bacterium]
MTPEYNMTKKHVVILISLILSIMILAVYWPVQFCEFTSYDDTIYTTKNYQVRQGINIRGIVYCFTDVHTGHWHPLTMMSHMLDWQLFGDKAGGHHWTNVIIHIFNTILLFLFLESITGLIWRSAFVAALFALHPLNVESVAWIAERKNVLSTFFWILTMILYAWYVKSPGWKRYLPVVFCFALGLMSKSMLVTLPFVLLLLDYWPLQRTTIDYEDEKLVEGYTAGKIRGTEKISFLILEKIPLMVLSAISIYLALYAAYSVKTVATLEAVPFLQRLSNAVLSYGLYIKKIFWPVDLAVFYPFNYQLNVWHLVLVASSLVIVTVFVCIFYRRLPFLTVGWFWYLGTLVPVIGVVQAGAQSMADRYTYVPAIGIYIMLTWGVFSILKKQILTKVTVLIFFGILVFLLISTHFQVKHWENSYTLYQQAIRVTSNNFMAYKNIGLYLIEQDKPDEALSYFNKAIVIKKEDATIHNSMGVALAMLGRNLKAVEQYEIALRLDQRHARAHSNLGVVLMRLGRDDEAMKHFQEAIKLGLEYPQAHYYLAEILERRGLYKEAAYHYEKAKLVKQGIEDTK